tara:strand:+ start:662 stop:1165 length:504 start_codon:yes stop_codon:yes gene_type:complete
MVRESIFNLLHHSRKISFKLEKSDILDLYSGTGSFGLECLSRKANKVIFIEKEKEAIKILKKNIEKLKMENRSKIFFGDVVEIFEKKNRNIFFQSSKMSYNLIFCDPPFKDMNINKLLRLIIEKKLLKKNGAIILHRHKNSKEKLINHFKIIEERVYGISKITFGEV